MAQGTGPFVRVPSVLVRHGRPVTVVEGHYEDATDELGAPLTAVDVVGHLLRHYGQALVVDLAGIEGGTPDLDRLRRLCDDIGDQGELWVDAGVRTAEDATDVVMAGAPACVLSTRSLRSLQTLEEIASVADQLVLAIDLGDDGAVVAADPSLELLPAEVVRLAARLGIGRGVLQRIGTAAWTTEALSKGQGLCASLDLLIAGVGSAAVEAHARQCGYVGRILPLLEAIEAVPEIGPPQG